jgi:hypothetical protein
VKLKGARFLNKHDGNTITYWKSEFAFFRNKLTFIFIIGQGRARERANQNIEQARVKTIIVTHVFHSLIGFLYY